MRHQILCCAIVLLAACSDAPSAAWAANQVACGPVTPSGIAVPPLRGRVVDGADILPPDVEARLVSVSEQLEQRTSDQLVIVTVPDLHGRDIAEVGLALGRGWRIGQAGKNNGVLLVVAPRERKVRIEVGRGLETVLSNARAAEIVEQDIVPEYRLSHLDVGTERGARVIAATLTAAADVPRVGGYHT